MLNFLFLNKVSPLIAILLISLLVYSCQPSINEEVAFYHWKSTFDLSATLDQLLENQEVERLFVKYLDIDLEGSQVRPVSPVRFIDTAHQAYDIVPCIYITNRTFQKDNLQPEKLAGQVWDYVQQINKKYRITPHEYQFDCDWTPSTRQAYFAFLNAIGKLKGEAVLNSTLRLHQLRYPEETGVPPVDKATLMYYNMGDIEDVEEVNSILNNEKGQAYLTGAAYPLKLDVALPVYSWYLVYRLGKLETIIKGGATNDLLEMDAIEKTGENTFLVKQNLYFEEHYLYKGDRLRLEVPTTDALKIAANALNKIKNRSGTLLFYHLDEALPSLYPPDSIDRIAKHYFQ